MANQGCSRPGTALPGATVADADRPREACGVFGAIRTSGQVAAAARQALIALQHRGEETAGLCTVDGTETSGTVDETETSSTVDGTETSGTVDGTETSSTVDGTETSSTVDGTETSSTGDGTEMSLVVDAGLVADVLTDTALAGLTGTLGVGHVRYSTAGGKSVDQAQPIVRRGANGWFAIAHNGTLIDCDAVAVSAGVTVGAEQSDTGIVASLLAAELDRAASLEPALLSTLPLLTGSYSFVLTDGVRLFGVRDPKGLRPLCLGRLDDGWALASETPALAAAGADFVREIEPGELVVIDRAQLRSVRPFAAETVESRLCLFEFVYFSRPDGELAGRSVERARVDSGRALAEFAPLPEDALGRPAVVVPVPSSGIPAASGYAQRSGLPLVTGLRRVVQGRSFLLPTQDERDQRVLDKLVAAPELVAGKRVVVVDDSLVRGTTARAVVTMLRRAGAAEVHFRIASPPWRYACHFGIDAGKESELAAGVGTMSDVLADIGCDSLAYLPLDKLAAAAGGTPATFCTGCMTGRYPLPVPAAAPRAAVDLFLSVRHRAAPVPFRQPSGVTR